MSLAGQRPGPDSAADGPAGGRCDGPAAGKSAGTADDIAAVVVATFPMPAGTRFDWHTHVDHQLAWAASGVLTVITEDATWVLPPTRALWIPAGLPHKTGAEGRATMRTLYIRPELCPVTWAEPTPVAASRLLAELIGYLGGTLDTPHRLHAGALLATC